MSLRQICARCMTPLRRISSLNAKQVALYSSSSKIPERPPDYDLYGTGYWNEGERLVHPPKPEYVPVEETKEDWQYVEKILPKGLIPEPPIHDTYPTPSGWLPQTASPTDNPFFVRRTRFHNFPIYNEIHDGGSRTMTVIKRVEGDLWAMEADLRTWLEEHKGTRMYTQVDEVTCKIRVRGTYLEECSEWLTKKGF